MFSKFCFELLAAEEVDDSGVKGGFPLSLLFSPRPGEKVQSAQEEY